MSTKTAFSARSNSSRSSIRPLSEFQLARLPLSLSLSLSPCRGTIITCYYLRVPKVWRGEKNGKKKKEWKKLLRVSLKKKKKKKRTRIYFREIANVARLIQEIIIKRNIMVIKVDRWSFIQDPLWCVRRKPRCGKCSFIGEKAKRKSYE